MTTTTTMSLIDECFKRVYRQLREDNGEDAPNSDTWYAATREDLAEEVGLGDSTTASILEGEPDQVVGPIDGEPVAWAYECDGKTLIRINDGASENELITLFGRCMGYDL